MGSTNITAPRSQDSTLLDGSAVDSGGTAIATPISSRKMNYDLYNNVTDVQELDFSSTAGRGAVLRQTHNDYAWASDGAT